MGFIQMIMVTLLSVICSLCASCRLLWAEEDHSWAAPLVQEVRMPSAIRSGVFYPEHDEMVIIRPGVWSQVKSQEQDAASVVSVVQETKGPVSAVTLSGRMKLTEVLKMIAAADSKDLMLGVGVEDREVTVDLKEEAVPQALRALLYPMGYGFKVDGRDLIVLARDTRVFRLNLPPVVQAFDTATTNESSSVASSGRSGFNSSTDGRARVGAKVIVENSSGPLSYWQDVEANVKGLVSAGAVVSFNKAAGVVVVTDSPHALDRLAVFFSDMNARAAEQITVDVKVVEVELSDEYKLGIDWGALAARGSLKGLDLSTNFASENMSSGNMLTFAARMDKEGSGDTESGVKAVLKALESFGRIEVVSQPRVMMLNNSVASIQAGETRSYIENTSMETTQGGGTITSATLNEVHGGVTLQIQGSIVGEDVFLNVTPVVSTIDDVRTITLGGGNKLEAPETSLKTMSTLVRVRAGRTVAIGGLITRGRSKERYGVPILCRIPLLGKAFSYELRRNKRTELVIFMTPRRS